jgi:DNA polymerase-3 subunit gamma/tau
MLITEVVEEVAKPTKPYISLPRKYRPQKFADLSKQDILIRVIQRSYLTQQLSQAYLLTGTRGVGKTTSARLIAKLVNCENVDYSLGQDQPEPCNQCANCRDIISGNHLDVIEIDAASKTGVDEIRTIIEGANYSPAQGSKKIYIIDEVHMLSRSAFNALLKTLEEPPENVIFILATTDVHKIPPTILSRCQRFALKNIDSETMHSRLASILEQEGYGIDADALEIIIANAEGSMRDGLSILEQAMHATAIGAEKYIGIDVIKEMLALDDYASYVTLIKLISTRESEELLDHWHKIHDRGVSPMQIVAELEHIIHHLTIYAQTNNWSTALPEYQKQELLSLQDNLELPRLMRQWQIIQRAKADMRYVTNMLRSIDMLLLRMAYIEGLPLLEEVKNTPNNVAKANVAKATDKKKTLVNGFSDWRSLVSSIIDNQQPILLYQLKHNVSCVKFSAHEVVIVITDAKADRQLIKEGLKNILPATTNLTIEEGCADSSQITTLKQQEQNNTAKLLIHLQHDYAYKGLFDNFTDLINVADKA